MKRPIVLAFAAAATLLCAGAAQAAHVNWSIGISLPPVGTVISSGPGYYPAPAPLYYPAPVVYAPPVYEESVPVYETVQPYYGVHTVYERSTYGYRGGRDVRWVAPRYDGRGNRDRDRDGRRDAGHDHGGHAVPPAHDRDDQRRHH